MNTYSSNHLNSFNYFINEGIHKTIDDFKWFNLHMNSNGTELIRVRMAEFNFGQVNQTPFQARLTSTSYSIDLFGTLEI